MIRRPGVSALRPTRQQHLTLTPSQKKKLQVATLPARERKQIKMKQTATQDQCYAKENRGKSSQSGI